MPEAVSEKKKGPNKLKKRKKKPRMLAYINESCTGCAGAPVCITSKVTPSTTSNRTGGMQPIEAWPGILMCTPPPQPGPL